MRNTRLVEIFKSLSQQRGFYMAFPEVRRAILDLHYVMGYSQRMLQEVTGFSRVTLWRWVKNGEPPPSKKPSRALRRIRRDQRLIELKDEVMRELWYVRECTNKLRDRGGKAGPQVEYVPKQAPTYYDEPYNPQEHDLEDEWELDDPI